MRNILDVGSICTRPLWKFRMMERQSSHSSLFFRDCERSVAFGSCFSRDFGFNCIGLYVLVLTGAAGCFTLESLITDWLSCCWLRRNAGLSSSFAVEPRLRSSFTVAVIQSQPPAFEHRRLGKGEAIPNSDARRLALATFCCDRRCLLSGLTALDVKRTCPSLCVRPDRHFRYIGRGS